jgi:hypothetical protein
MNRRQFIKTGLLFVPTIFACNQGIARLGNLEPEVSVWINRVRGRSGSPTGTGIVANDFIVKALKANALRSSIIYLNILAGVGLNSLTAPLINDPRSSTADSPQNLDEPDFAESTGLSGNGTNEFMLAGVQQGDLYALDSTNHSFTYGAYVCSSNNQSGFAMGEYDGSNYCYLYVSNGSGHSFFSTGISANQIDVADSAGTGFYCGSYNTTTDAKLYKGGAQIGTSATPGATHNNGYYVGLMDVNNQNSLGAVAPSTKTWGCFLAGRGIAGSIQPALNDIVKRTMGILGRPVS